MPIDATEFDEYLQFANELADAAAGAILPHFRAGSGAENKSARGFDPVTAADRGAERVMRALIRARYPDHGILGEEEGTQAGSSGLTAGRSSSYLATASLFARVTKSSWLAV
ncbi:hypothetical protein GCM10025794_21730 [Massilia kyonggiensis]